MAPYDLLGNIVLVKFQRETALTLKKRWALSFLKEHERVTTVLEKTGRIKGRLRTPETKWLAGEKTKEVLYHENGCSFRFNVDTCYFSPRLAAERKTIASLVKKRERVLVLFGGVAVYAIVIGKTRKPARVVSIELGREGSTYARENVRRNKVAVDIIQGDVKKALLKMRERFDRIVMARPNVPDTFLAYALHVVKHKGTIHYYGFCHEDELERMQSQLVAEARKVGRNITIRKVTKAGDIGMRTYRYRIDLAVS